jgi:Bacterial Ig-like domain/PKD domain
LKTSRFRVSALACALIAVCVGGGTTAAAADSTPPTLSVETSPANPTPGTVVTITATVTPGTNPDSAGLAVNCNLSWANLPSSSPLTPDASGLVFTREVTVPSNALPGERISSCRVTDDQDRFSSAPYSVNITAATADEAPTLSSHTPDSDAIDVAPDANIGIVFSEPVDVTGAWYLIACDASGPHTAVVTGGPTSYLLNPEDDFADGEGCTVTLDPTLITDQDSNDPPDDLAGDTSWSFTVASAPENQPPTVSANGPYTVDEGATAHLSATGSDPEEGVLTYAWDLDDNGTFETAGQNVDLAAADGPASRTVSVQVTDGGGMTAVDTTTVSISNVAPTATFTAPASDFAGFTFPLSLTSPDDASSADVAAGFTYAFDCGDGYGSFSATATASCPTSDTGTLSVGAEIRDKDGGVTEYRATVDVVVTFSSLCDLVSNLVTDPDVAAGLCAKLAAAARAGERGDLGAEQNQLQAFRNQVDAQTAKTISAADATLLKTLSTRL